jgi:hypothetical protein
MHALPIAERWLVRTPVGDAVTLLIQPHVNDLLHCNIGHVRRRGRDLLVEPGLGVASQPTSARPNHTTVS